jgi:hypothetical protein
MVVVGVLIASEGGDVRSRPRPCRFTVSLEITGVTRRVEHFSYRMTRRVGRFRFIVELNGVGLGNVVASTPPCSSRTSSETRSSVLATLRVVWGHTLDSPGRNTLTGKSKNLIIMLIKGLSSPNLSHGDQAS